MFRKLQSPPHPTEMCHTFVGSGKGKWGVGQQREAKVEEAWAPAPLTSYPWSPQGKVTMETPEICLASYPMCPHHPSLRHRGHLWLQNALSSSPASLTTSHPSLQSATTSQHQPNEVQIEVCCAMATPIIPAPPPSTVPPQSSGFRDSQTTPALSHSPALPATPSPGMSPQALEFRFPLPHHPPPQLSQPSPSPQAP